MRLRPLHLHARTCAALLFLGLSCALADGPSPTGQILVHADVPNALLKQGEVQLLQRGNCLVARSSFHSRHLRRVLAHIRKGEWHNWPPDHLLSSARSEYFQTLENLVTSAVSAGGRQRLTIEFQTSPELSQVVLFRETSDPVALLRLPRDYVFSNTLFIIEEAAGLSRRDVEAIIRRSETMPNE